MASARVEKSAAKWMVNSLPDSFFTLARKAGIALILFSCFLLFVIHQFRRGLWTHQSNS